MDLALNNLQRLICLKTKQTNQPNQPDYSFIRMAFTEGWYDFIQRNWNFETLTKRKWGDGSDIRLSMYK